jgi:hypothetical protein
MEGNFAVIYRRDSYDTTTFLIHRYSVLLSNSRCASSTVRYTRMARETGLI